MGVNLEHFHGFVASVFALVRSFQLIPVLGVKRKRDVSL